MPFSSNLLGRSRVTLLFRAGEFVGERALASQHSAGDLISMTKADL
jgi:hypothetical protein